MPRADSAGYQSKEIMNLIRNSRAIARPVVHAPKDINTLFELPFRSTADPQTQLFDGWMPALDLYQDNDNVVAVAELPGMRKEDIEISLHDRTLAISGERKYESAHDDKMHPRKGLSPNFAARSACPHASTRRNGI